MHRPFDRLILRDKLWTMPTAAPKKCLELKLIGSKNSTGQDQLFAGISYFDIALSIIASSSYASPGLGKKIDLITIYAQRAEHDSIKPLRGVGTWRGRLADVGCLRCLLVHQPPGHVSGVLAQHDIARDVKINNNQRDSSRALLNRHDYA